jgi:outer membrane lipoprotein carrier protein
MWQILLTVLALAPKTPSADEIVGKVQSFYQDTKKLSADFRQEFTNVTFGRTSKSDGKVYIAKPGKMRWDYVKPEKKYFISDGTTLWVYEEEAKQAFEKSLKEEILPVAVTFLYGKGDLRAEFTPALDPGKYGGADDLCIKLTPKKPEAQYKQLWLVVDPRDFHVKESVILEATDNVNHFTFLNVKQNADAKFEDKHFKFVPPAGVKVLKAGEEGKAK